MAWNGTTTIARDAPDALDIRPVFRYNLPMQQERRERHLTSGQPLTDSGLGNMGSAPGSPVLVFKPMDDLWERVGLGKQDSDVTLFLNLMYLGEALVKIVTAGMIAAIDDDKDRNRYRLLHRLVRADGLGEWADALDDSLVGPASQSLRTAAREPQRDLTQKLAAGSWQHDATSLMHDCLRQLQEPVGDVPVRCQGGAWFRAFVELRNKPRGHGATTHATCSLLCPHLERSLALVSQNCKVLKCQWAYLHRNLSGKYRVTRLSQQTDAFDYLRSTKSVSLANGVHVWLDTPVRVELVDSDPDATGFYFPNGGFTGKDFELICYSTDDRKRSDAAPYLFPTGNLPPSETQGLGSLDVQGTGFGNLPPARDRYVRRRALEAELVSVIENDYNQVVTLYGRGGIGKTWLALAVLHEVANRGRYDVIFWFSARDIDLLSTGPRMVTPHVLTKDDVAREFIRLTQPNDAKTPGFKPIEFLQSCMQKSPFGPVLLVFDNFETFRSPSDIFAWMAAHIRPPNKILITTRKHEFKGDYPAEVGSMMESECAELVDLEGKRLGIADRLTPKVRQSLYEDSYGYPYVIKVFLGEMAAKPNLQSVEPVLAGRDDILSALFERTYSGLSPGAKRVFLTLCAWRSVVPELAVKAAVLRPGTEHLDVDVALAELERSSMVEVLLSDKYKDRFVFVPLAASMFGAEKLAVSPMRTAVEADSGFLQLFGPARPSGVRHGLAPRVLRLFRAVAERVGREPSLLDGFIPTLELISRQYPPGWLLLADLYSEFRPTPTQDDAKETVRRYLQATARGADQLDAWRKLARMCGATGDFVGEVHALLEISELPGGSLSEISGAANRVNHLFATQRLALDTTEKKIVVGRLARALEERIDEGDSTDCSRLAWLFLHMGDESGAERFARRGLLLEPGNEYCQSVLSSIQSRRSRRYR